MSEIANFLDLVDPWWFLVLAFVILLIDWLIAGEIFLIIALACFLLTGAKFLNFSGNVLTWLIPLFLALSLFFQRQIIKPFLSARLPIEAKSIIGNRGIIEEVQTKNESKDVFYKYDESIEQNKDTEIVSSFRFVNQDGSSNVIKNTQGLIDGQQGKIISNDNGIVTVEVIK
jgi:membrane protein implicated in regulation of membrane protease activity